MKNNCISLYHNPILFIPILGELLYLLQIFLFKRGLLKTLYISNKKQKYREKLIETIRNDKILFCHSYKFGRLLKNFSAQVVFDKPGINIKSMSQDELYNLMWTLLFCDAVTTKTKISLGSFLPSDFSEYSA